VRVVAVEPAGSCGSVATLVPAGVVVIPQPPGSLGDRMSGVMRTLFDRGARAVVLVGSDLPDLDARIVEDAFAILAREPSTLVLGPAADGGYYLIGSTRVPDVFSGIEWGSARVCAQTQASAERAGVAVTLLEVIADVDTVADLRRVRAARTRAWWERNGVRR
jgi:uncharacterized protein